VVANCDHLITGKDPILLSPFLIGEAGAAALAAVGYLSSALWCLKSNTPPQRITVAVKEAAIAQRSHEYIRVINGKNEALWNPISGFYETKDNRWIQLHCNFPQHQEGVISFLHCDNNRTSVEKAVSHWQASVLEEQLSNLGLCAAMVRTPDEWRLHPQSAVIDTLPLMEIIKIGDSEPEPLPSGNRPLSGIKVLDLTRVIADPVCGKTLAEHGATVMRISSPQLPFILPLVMDTGFGKLSAYLVRVSLAQTAHWFKQLGRVTTDFSQCEIPTREQLKDILMQKQSAFGELEFLPPILKMSETPPYLDKMPVPLGSDEPKWPL